MSSIDILQTAIGFGSTLHISMHNSANFQRHGRQWCHSRNNLLHTQHPVLDISFFYLLICWIDLISSNISAYEDQIIIYILSQFWSEKYIFSKTLFHVYLSQLPEHSCTQCSCPEIAWGTGYRPLSLDLWTHHLSRMLYVQNRHFQLSAQFHAHLCQWSTP